MLNRKDVYIRDPFIVPIEEEKKYYMFGTTDKNCWGDEKATGFDYYITRDLETFEGPYAAFRPEKNFWADRNFWAPEVHYYKGKYYMFATFYSEKRNRGTQILVSEKVSGPYVPHSDGPITPPDWMCLDGTLYVDEKSNPWMIFCHEWVQIYDGEICAIQLSDDLKYPVGSPVLLFKASEAPWAKSMRIVDGNPCFVTDGPFIYKTKNNKLLMLWSSFNENRSYTIGIAYSTSGNIFGPWKHIHKPLYSNDGGHGMLFKAFDGTLMLSIHSPNSKGNERPLFIKIDEKELENIDISI